jgi:hypothetical protein
MTPNTFRFPTGPNGTEVLRLSKDGIWANPDIPADDAAKLVLSMLDNSIKSLVQKAVEKERDACAKVGKDALPNHLDLGLLVEAAIKARGSHD